MAIRDFLFPELKRRFPDVGIRFMDSPAQFALIPCPNPEIGEVEIWDDGNEATVVVRNVTHGHFNCWGTADSLDQAEKKISQDVAEFLSELIEDRVLLWAADDNRSGGWSLSGVTSSGLRPNARNHVWSGPLSPLPPVPGGGVQ